MQVDAPWVIGAEGAHSAVRTSVGIELVGEAYPERFLVVSVAEELSDHLPDLAYVNYVADPAEWLVLLRTPDHWRVLFPVADDDGIRRRGPRADESIQSRLGAIVDLGRALGGARHLVVRRGRRVATSMRCGRVLLAGDAAHQNSPLGGMGMNSGIQDAVSLGRRLGRVWQGEPDELLDEYDLRRRRVATEFVQARQPRELVGAA